MKDLLLTLLHLAVMIARLCSPGGVRAVIAEHFLLKQPLIVVHPYAVVRRTRRRGGALLHEDSAVGRFGPHFS